MCGIYLVGSVFSIAERSVALLPKELACAQERLRMFEFPAHYVVPLVELVGQVAMGLNPLGERRVHARLARRPDGDVLGEVGRA